MQFGSIGVQNFYGVQFLKCITGYYYCSNSHQKELRYFPPKVHILDCSRNQITSIDDLPKGLRTLNADNNLISKITYLPEGLKYCSIINNKLTTLPKFPSSLEWLNYMGNPIDTALLGTEYRDNPCLYREQNCMPKKKKFESLLGIKKDSLFEANKLAEIEIKISKGNSPTPDYFFRFKVEHNKFICDSIISNNVSNALKMDFKNKSQKGFAPQIGRILDHILNGDKILPLIDIKPSDTTTQIIDFYKQFDGEAYMHYGCGEFPAYTYSFIFYSSNSQASFSIQGCHESPDGILGTYKSSIVFETKKVAEWMYAYSIASQLLSDEEIIKLVFQEGYFMQFKKRMGLN